MSWWWAAPLAVAALGTAALYLVARAAAGETEQAARVSEDLRAALVDLRATRGSLVVELEGHILTSDLTIDEQAGAAEKGPVGQ